MDIELAHSAGFCFGVRRAIKIAQDLTKKGIEVSMLGDLVHNEAVISQLEADGIHKIARLGKGQGKMLLIRAHGTSKEHISKARKHGYKIVDATCPMVREIHKITRRMDKLGYTIIIIGDRRHDEVRGIVGQIRRKPVVIESLVNNPQNAIKRIKKAAIVVQSTQNLKQVEPIVEMLQKEIAQVKFFNTICRPTRQKQEEIRMLARHSVLWLFSCFIGRGTVKRLYEISMALNPHSFWIQNDTKIEPDWFKNIKTVGITVGASTPDSTTLAVIKCIKQITERE
mgnify:CR=1 FL=1